MLGTNALERSRGAVRRRVDAARIDGRILVDEDLFAAHGVGDTLSALDCFLADDDFFGDSRLLLDVNRLGAQWHLDDGLLEGVCVRRCGGSVDHPPLDADALLRQRDL